MDSGSDPEFKYPDIPASAEIGDYMLEPSPCEAVNQPNRDEQGIEIQSSSLVPIKS